MKTRRKFAIGLLFGLLFTVLVGSVGLVAQGSTGLPFYLAIWEQGKPLPTAVTVGAGLEYDRATQELRTTVAAPSYHTIVISDKNYASTEITLETGGVGVVAAPSTNGPVYLVHSQAFFYPRVTQAEFDGGTGGYYVAPDKKVRFRPYSVTQGVVRVAVIALQ